MTYEFNPLLTSPVVLPGQKVNFSDYDRNSPFFPFYFDKGTGLHIGYILRDLSADYDRGKDLTPELLSRTLDLQIMSFYDIKLFFGYRDYRVTEVYFERPNCIYIEDGLEEFPGSIDVNQGIIHYDFPDSIKKCFEMGIDGLTWTCHGGGAMILHNPAKYIKGALWKDYKTTELKDYRHLFNI